jgi:ATP-binding cassette subfamily F protein 3
MDEPTNHLDLETIEALIMAINNYSGGVMVVSHDQHFLQSVCKDFWGVSHAKVILHMPAICLCQCHVLIC